ncbi:hypothetical protein BpHYR1_031933 [Brachionus plicatilis]|uniref:Uncharacterized protein n=1 Tax=Brachionus plicatilis TaxID=10195 RepID=A0A3M7PNX7_BRAPC|nr:hypothetical protein BpHYR1_031933 [Brachionus plicatilis]
MAMNNRKFLTSTGVLLKNLNEEPKSFVTQNSNMYQSSYNQSNQFNQSYHQQANFSNFQFNNKKMYNNQPFNPMQNSQANLPDIMVLPNSNSMSQHRWQQKPNRSQNRSNKGHKISAKKTHSTSAINTISNSSSVSELPETFGLPSNHSSKSNLLGKHASSTNLEKSDMIAEDSAKSPQKSDDIEIISEINTSPSADDLNLNLKNYLKNYSLKNLNLPVATKPQSNFVSNFNLIDQLIKKSEFYSNKLKRCKPYSNIKANQILTMESDDSDDEDPHTDNKLKTKKVILIDDTNEEMHKPWITPELIKLIKHRNLLQSKIQADSEANNVELMKKFKNLRNKVTKLVKKARKEYLTKYIQESKENKIKSAEESKTSVSTSSADQGGKSHSDTEKKSPQKETSAENEQKSTPLAITSNQNVNEITKKLNASGSFLKDSSTLMMIYQAATASSRDGNQDKRK